MDANNKISVFSEIGPLKTVLLHRPGAELENLTPDLLHRLLFDDIPYLVEARKEHKVFSDMLESKGVKVLYIEQLVKEALDTDPKIKSQFLDQFLTEAHILNQHMSEMLKTHLTKLPTQDMVDTLIGGLRVEDFPNYERNTLYEKVVYTDFPFILEPMPNTLFTRDPFSTIGNGVSLHYMTTDVRNRETIFGEYVFKYHPVYSQAPSVPLFYNKNKTGNIEGGDIHIWNPETIAIGVSERTSPQAIEMLARSVFFEHKTSFKKVIAIQLESKRAFMHLDTVLTQLDRDKFAIQAEIKGPMRIFVITPGQGEYGLKVEESHDVIENLMAKVFGHAVQLIPCGNGSLIDSQREQWNDGANTLAVAPGEVFVYARNHVTNELLDKNGIKLNVVPSAELSRGRGGPRCMSMPFVREMI